MTKIRALLTIYKRALNILKRKINQLVSSVDNEDELLAQTSDFIEETKKEIITIHQNAESLADNHSEKRRKSTLNRDLLVSSALLVLFSHIHRRIALEEGQWRERVKTSLQETVSYIDKIARNETFSAYNQKILTNNPDKQLIWNAILDKRVCKDCEELDGQIFNKSNAPDCPLHINCRCILEVKE